MYGCYKQTCTFEKEVIRTKHAEYMDKKLSQAIMKCSKLRNDYLKHISEENRLVYKTQRHFRVTLLGEKSRLF